MRLQTAILPGSISVGSLAPSGKAHRCSIRESSESVTVENRSLSIPDTDRHWITGGVTYTLNDSTTFDFAYAYINGREANIDKSRDIGSITSTIEGSQSATAHVLSAQVNMSF